MYVYLMRDTNCQGMYKIGKSNNPKYREGTLQYEKPSIELVYWQLMKSDRESLKRERYFHDLFKDCRVRGEWFTLTLKQVLQIKYMMHNNSVFEDLPRVITDLGTLPEPKPMPSERFKKAQIDFQVPSICNLHNYIIATVDEYVYKDDMLKSKQSIAYLSTKDLKEKWDNINYHRGLKEVTTVEELKDVEYMEKYLRRDEYHRFFRYESGMFTKYYIIHSKVDLTEICGKYKSRVKKKFPIPLSEPIVREFLYNMEKAIKKAV